MNRDPLHGLGQAALEKKILELEKHKQKLREAKLMDEVVALTKYQQGAIDAMRYLGVKPNIDLVAAKLGDSSIIN